MRAISPDTLLVAATIFACLHILGTFAYLAFRHYVRLKERELENSAKMTVTREHLESKLSQLNKEFLSSIEQWRDANHQTTSSLIPN